MPEEISKFFKRRSILLLSEFLNFQKQITKTIRKTFVNIYQRSQTSQHENMPKYVNTNEIMVK